MSASPRRLAGITLALVVGLCATRAMAQQPPAPPSPPAAEASAPADEKSSSGEEEPPVELTPEELAEIEAALGQDAAAAQRSPPAPPPTLAPAPGTTQGPLPMPFIPGMAGLELSLILDVAAAAFTSPEPLQTGGHDPIANGFTLQQLELAVASVVDPYFRFDGNIVFAETGVEIEEAYATSLNLPANLQLRAGRFLTRFGRINATHPHSWSFVDQPFAVGRVFGAEGNGGLGAEVSWLSPLPWYLEVLGSVTDAASEANARSFLGGGAGGVVSPLDFQFTGAVKQFFDLSLDWSLLWGLSAATGPNPTGYRNRTDVFGTDLYVKYRPTAAPTDPYVSLQAEVFYRRRQVPRDLLSDLSGYGQLVWRHSRWWATAARYEFGTPALDLDGRVANDALDPDWTRLRQRISANVTYWPTEFTRVRLQGASDVAGWRERPDLSVFLAFEVVMGAHGAHAF